MTESEKLLDGVAKALGFKGEPDPQQLKAAIDAVVKQAEATAALEAALAGKAKTDEESPAEEKAEGEAPPPMAEASKEDEDKKDEKVEASKVSLSAEEDKKEEDKVEASDSAPPAVSAADAPDAGAAAGKQILEALMTATGLDAAGVVALVQDNLEAISKLGNAQPESGSATDAPPAEGATADAAMSADPVAASKAAAADAVITGLAKQIADLKAYKLSIDNGAAEKAAEERVARAVTNGQILDSDREVLLQLARTAPATFDKWMLSKAPAVPVGEDSKPPAPSTQAATTNLTDEQNKAYRGHIAAGISHERARELATNPALGMELRKRYQTKR